MEELARETWQRFAEAGPTAWAAASAAFGLIGALLGRALRRRPLTGLLLGGLAGPVGWLLLLVVRDAGSEKCGNCGRYTGWRPLPGGWSPQGGSSYPHLRCDHCGSIIPG